MKDFVREYGKLAGFTALGAFFLSLLVGLVSGNPFGTAIVRALLFAVFFACLAGGAKYAVRKYLPEMMAAQPSRDEGASGQNIDITLGEENPVAAGRAFARSRSSAGQREPPPAGQGQEPSGEPQGAYSPRGRAEPPVSGLEQPEEGAAGNDLEDALPPLTDADVITDAGADGVDSGEEIVEEAESVSEDGPADSAAAADRTPEAPEQDPDLGSLPDISSLGGPAEGGHGSSAGGRPEAPGRRSGRGPDRIPTPGDEMKGALGGQDPATLARAIRTVLKRDEKG